MVNHKKNHMVDHMENENVNENSISSIQEGGKGETTPYLSLEARKIQHKAKYEEVCQNEVWIEDVAIKCKSSVDEARAFLLDFLDELFLKEDFEKDRKEIMRHFVNWFKIQLIKKLQNKLGKSVAPISHAEMRINQAERIKKLFSTNHDREPLP
jgi:hypothetical protein